jgi:hypothetical protein
MGAILSSYDWSARRPAAALAAPGPAVASRTPIARKPDRGAHCGRAREAATCWLHAGASAQRPLRRSSRAKRSRINFLPVEKQRRTSTSAPRILNVTDVKGGWYEQTFARESPGQRGSHCDRGSFYHRHRGSRLQRVQGEPQIHSGRRDPTSWRGCTKISQGECGHTREY